tara:strand:- start:1045 stop:1248 length:204 start_codon:yes stop_codon:yes gene_type:complete
MMCAVCGANVDRYSSIDVPFRGEGDGIHTMCFFCVDGMTMAFAGGVVAKLRAREVRSNAQHIFRRPC